MRQSLKIFERHEYDLLLALLAKARQDANLSQSALARKLGRAQPYISKLESGDQRLDVVEFLDICRAIGTDPAALMADWDRQTR